MLPRYCLSVFEMVPAAAIITGINFAFTSHMRWISIMRSLHYKNFSASFLITFLSPGIATSVNIHVPCLLSGVMMSGLMLGIVLSFRTCRIHYIVTLPSRLLSSHSGTWSYYCLLSNSTPLSLHM
jgi:hypothetical protein